MPFVRKVDLSRFKGVVPQAPAPQPPAHGPVSFRKLFNVSEDVRQGKSPERPLTKESVQNFLDQNIRQFRETRDTSSNETEVELVTRYIEAYQAVRYHLLGETLETDLGEAWKKMGNADWKRQAQESKASMVADLLFKAGIPAKAAEKADEAKRMEVAKEFGKSSMSAETWAIAMAMLRDLEKNQAA